MRPDRRHRLYRFSPADLALIVLLLVLPAWYFFSLARPKSGKVVANIYHAGESVGTYPVDQDTAISLADAGLTIEIKAGRVRVEQSNCPNQVCVRTGWISRPGRTIVCVPNKVLVELRGTRSDIDAESY